MVFEGLTIQVKASERLKGHLIFGHDYNSPFRTNIGVQVFSTIDPDIFRVAGFMHREEFERIHEVRTFGYGAASVR